MNRIINYIRTALFIIIALAFFSCVGTDQSAPADNSVSSEASEPTDNTATTEPSISDDTPITSTNANINFVLEVLENYSPNGYKIVRDAWHANPAMIEAMISTFIFFGVDPLNLPNSINTVVHEVCHIYQGGTINSYNYYIFLDESITVNITDVFPSEDLAPLFSEELKTFRFDTYIYPSEPTQTTQVYGIYGLLDEFSAYFNGTRAAYDIYPYYLENGDKESWHEYFLGVYRSMFGILEFKLYILKYLIYAEQNNQNVYTNIMANEDFKKAFIKIHENSYNFIEEFFNKKHELFSHMREKELEVNETTNLISIEYQGERTSYWNYIDVCILLAEEMEKQEYIDMMTQIGFPDPDRPFPDPEL